MRELVKSYQFENFCSDLLLSSLERATEACDFIVADEHTATLLAEAPDLVLPSGEQNKTLAQIEQLIAAFAQQRLLRSSTVLAFGGGLLCDLVGFAAASYMRGCGLVLVPTTLLSMIDAGLGGKTACNYQNYKNMIGAFYPAREVRLVPQVLASLPPREFKSGLAELCKHTLLSDTADLWQKLDKQAGRLQAPCLFGATAEQAALDLSDLLMEAVEIKGQIVQCDLYERSERAFLNLGHSYAHALEKISAFACTHGEAVAWGINQALQLSASLGYCSQNYAAQVHDLLCKIGFVLNLAQLCPQLSHTGIDSIALHLVEAMELDKKRSQSGIRLILQQGRGQTFIEEVDAAIIHKTLKKYL